MISDFKVQIDESKLKKQAMICLNKIIISKLRVRNMKRKLKLLQKSDKDSQDHPRES